MVQPGRGRLDAPSPSQTFSGVTQSAPVDEWRRICAMNRVSEIPRRPCRLVMVKSTKCAHLDISKRRRIVDYGVAKKEWLR